MDKYQLLARLARRIGSTTVVVDRGAILSNLRWEVDGNGRMAKDHTYRSAVRLILAGIMDWSVA